MPFDRADLALFDIRDNIALAMSFTDSVAYEQFKADRMRFYATTRALEIISEAARRLPEKTRERHPALPWREIMGVGNIYRHNYDNVVEDIVWRTARESLDPLLKVVQQEIKQLDQKL